MECGVSSEVKASEISDTAKLSNAFMFTEEQITKQLVDMREQTDFMKRFRCALGIALREIKTLRTNSLNDSSSRPEEDTQRTTHSPSALPTDSSGSYSNLYQNEECKSISTEAGTEQHHQCVCADVGNVDLRILREYLSKMEIEDDTKSKPSTPRKRTFLKCDSLEKVKDDSKALIEKSIGHIERLKENVERKNDLVKKLCQQLTQARLVRVKRETKLEQKLQEIATWKEKYEKIKKSNDKQVHISRSLRVALNAEIQKVQSSKNMAIGLDETRKAFNSLKSQAGQLMESLREKDLEIEELSARLAKAENPTASHRSNELPQGGLGVQSDLVEPCTDCNRRVREIESLRMNYDRVIDDFSRYRRSHPPPSDFVAPANHTHVSRDYPQNHPYGRRMHASYTSAESYRRVSRPPLRRRLNYGNQFSLGKQTHNRTNSNIAGDTLLSPIDEFVENQEECRDEPVPSANDSALKSPHTYPLGVDAYGSDYSERLQQPHNLGHPRGAPVSPSINGGLDSVHESTDQNNSGHLSFTSDLARQEVRLDSVGKAEVTESTKTSYLELGNSASPSPQSPVKSVSKAGPIPQTYTHAFIRRCKSNENTNLGPELSNGPGDETDPADHTHSPVSFDQLPSPYGVLWHPALQENATNNFMDDNSSMNEVTIEKLEILQKPTKIALFGSDDIRDNKSEKLETSSQRSKSCKQGPHCVTYKGHKIDVTDFSIHGFRDILWSLDGGSESADDFIKFLASTAKKLNASPKWAGKHSMGNPDDWLALRGLY